MQAQHGENLNAMLIKTLVKELAIKGALHILRHGFKFYGKVFRLNSTSASRFRMLKWSIRRSRIPSINLK